MPRALMLYGTGDAAWAACLMLDLRSRGVDVADHRAPIARAGPAREVGLDGLVVVRSWLPGGRLEASDELVRRVRARNGPYVVALRNWTRLGPDDCPGRTHQFALWDTYYQPVRRPSGKGDGGFVNLLHVLRGENASMDLPSGYVFISYHHGSDGTFVHDQLRPVLSRAGLTSWAYRTSERIPDNATRERLDQLISRASLLLVVSSPQWWTPWSDFEVHTARKYGLGIVAVQPAGARPSRRSILAHVPSTTLEPESSSAALLVGMITASGTRPYSTP